MNQWRSKSEQIHDLENQVKELRSELDRIKEQHSSLQQQHQTLKIQNDRLMKMEAQHQSAKASLIQKRIILSRAIILVPESLVIGDRLENSVIKVFRGNNLTLTDTAELVNCRIIGLDRYADEKAGRMARPIGTIEIKGVFRNSDPNRFSVSTHEKVVIGRGARFTGNIRAATITVSDLTKVRGRFATRDLLAQRRADQTQLRKHSNVLEINVSKSR